MPRSLIGGEYCHAALEPRLIPGHDQQLTDYELEELWRIFQEIGRCWKDLYWRATDSSNLKSSWLEFVHVKTSTEPNYVGEYSNAVAVVDELKRNYGDPQAYTKLFLENGIPDGPPLTRLAHAKKFVVDEFIHVNIMTSGFKSFGGRNYRGYIGGSRYKLRSRVRTISKDKESD